MPKPPLLDTINWKAVSESGLDFDAWLNVAENQSNRDKMAEIYKNQSIPEDTLSELNAIDRPLHIVAIAEDWCGDVVQHVPVLQKIADHSDHIHLRYITREDNKDVFVRYLTNGGEAIPKFIFLNDNFVECGTGGPCPKNSKTSSPKAKPAEMSPPHEKSFTTSTSTTTITSKLSRNS